ASLGCGPGEPFRRLLLALRQNCGFRDLAGGVFPLSLGFSRSSKDAGSLSTIENPFGLGSAGVGIEAGMVRSHQRLVAAALCAPRLASRVRQRHTHFAYAR